MTNKIIYDTASYLPDLRQFNSSKQKIVIELKTRGSSSLAELADILSMSKMGILKHVEQLEEHNIVERYYKSQGVGRPRLFFKLTQHSQSIFPRAYSGLTCSVLEYIQDKLGEEGVEQALTKRQLETFDEYDAKLSGLNFPDKVKKLAKIRDQDGYFVELKMLNQKAFELTENNCPILEVAERFNIACSIERNLFANLLDADVDITHRVVAENNTCKFLFKEKQHRG